MINNKIIVSLAAIFFVAVTSYSQVMPSLLISSDPSALGGGGACVSSNANAFAIENNMASVSLSENHLDAAFSFGMWQPSTLNDKFIGVGASGKIGDRLGLGLSVEILNQPAYTITNSVGVSPQIGASFKPTEMNFALGTSYKIIECLSAGIVLRLATSSLAESAKCTAFATDISLFYSNKNLNAGLAVCNLGTKAKYGNNSYSLPGLVKAGVGYSIIGITVNGELDYMFCNALMASVSAAYWYKTYAGLKIGYHYGNNTKAIPSYASVGLGACVKGIHLDCAYLFGNKALKNTFCVGLGYSF